MVVQHVLKAGSKQPFFFQERIKLNVASHDTVVQWLMVLCFYIVTCHVYLLFYIALHF